MTDMTFSIAGYSKLSNGQYKARFANNSVKARTVLLQRNGQTDIVFLDLPQSMGKAAAAQYVLDNLDVPPAAGVALKRAQVNGTGSETVALSEVVEAMVAKTKVKTKGKAKTEGKAEIKAEIEA